MDSLSIAASQVPYYQPQGTQAQKSQQVGQQQPIVQMAQAPQTDTVNFSGAAAQQPQKEGSLFSLKGLVLAGGTALLGVAAYKTHGTLKAFKELDIAADGFKPMESGLKKVSETHSLSKIDVFLHHFNPLNLFRDEKEAVKGMTQIGDSALHVAKGGKAPSYLGTIVDGDEVFKHGNSAFKLDKKKITPLKDVLGAAETTKLKEGINFGSDDNAFGKSLFDKLADSDLSKEELEKLNKVGYFTSTEDAAIRGLQLNDHSRNVQIPEGSTQEQALAIWENAAKKLPALDPSNALDKKVIEMYKKRLALPLASEQAQVARIFLHSNEVANAAQKTA